MLEKSLVRRGSPMIACNFMSLRDEQMNLG